MAQVESDHFQSLVPRKEASITAFMLEDSFKVSGPGRPKWSSRRNQADAADHRPGGKSDTLGVWIALDHLQSTFISDFIYCVSTPCEYKDFTKEEMEAQGKEITCPWSYSTEKGTELRMNA